MPRSRPKGFGGVGPASVVFDLRSSQEPLLSRRRPNSVQEVSRTVSKAEIAEIVGLRFPVSTKLT